MEQAPVAGHERRDVRPTTVVAWGVGILLLVVFTAGAMWLLLGGYESREARESPPASPLAGYGPQEPPQPRLQVDPAGDIDKLRATERARLEGYGWVDRDAGSVHIPIERAMQLLIERRSGGAK
jgi:hypothetical protein